MSAPSPKRIERVQCDACGAEYLATETACWKCGARPARTASPSDAGSVDFTAPKPVSPPETPPHVSRARSATTLTGEVVELPDFSAPAAGSGRQLFGDPVPQDHQDALVRQPPDRSETELADFSAPAPSTHVGFAPEGPPPATRFATTLTGEVVELPDLSAPAPFSTSSCDASAEETKPVEAAAGAPVMRLTYCKACGLQNDEAAIECRKCRRPLEIISEPIGDVKPLRRSWGFDLLGLAWLVLGVAAVYCGQFIVKADREHPGITWADYFWTGIVVCAPGVLVFMRHYFCKFLFWLLMFSSLLVWSVIGFIWLYIGLHVTDNGMVGLMWLGALSGLSLISYITVRLNDEFDYGT